jgi:fructose-specific phosphotransferase system IIA component
MKIIDYLCPDCISVRINIKTKQELLKYMVELGSKSGKILNKELVLNDVLEREHILSTGVGKGIALPHAKTNAVDSFLISWATLENPLEYNSLDSNPVNIIILILGPEGNVGMNLKILSKISRLLNNEEFRYLILSAQNSGEIISVISKFDN